jgi:hypothetical protein
MRACWSLVFPFCILAASWGQEAKSNVDSKGAKTKSFSDNILSFPLPEGGTVNSVPQEQTYLVTFGTDIIFFRLRGVAEPDDFGRQRADASRKETLAAKGIPQKVDESTVTVREVFDVTKHLVGNDAVYLFSFKADSAERGETTTEYCTIGFGTVQGHAVWFQQTGPAQQDQPKMILDFLHSVTFHNNSKAQGSGP